MAQIIKFYTLLFLISLYIYGCSPDTEVESDREGGASSSNNAGEVINTDEAGTETQGGVMVEAGVEELEGGVTEAGIEDGGEVTIEAGEERVMMSDCTPHDDQCPEGQYCQYLEGQLRCIDNEEVEPDPQFHYTPNCPTGVCSRGGICHQVYRGEILPEPRCFWTCDPVSAGSRGDCPNVRHTCYQAEDAEGQLLPFAICDY